MEYERQCGVIYADLASRAAGLPKQYSLLAKGVDEDARLDATLTICVAQLVLAASNELITAMSDGARDAVDRIRTDLDALAAKAEYTYPPGRELTAARLLDHLRNAFSHPVPRVAALLASTGYSTVGDESKSVRALTLTDSYWVKDGKVHFRWRNKTRATVEKNVQAFEKDWGCEGWLYVERDGQYYCVFSTETRQKYVPLCQVTLTLDELNSLSRWLGEAYEIWLKTLDAGTVKALLTPALDPGE